MSSHALTWQWSSGNMCIYGDDYKWGERYYNYRNFIWINNHMEDGIKHVTDLSGLKIYHSHQYVNRGGSQSFTEICVVEIFRKLWNLQQK